MNLHHAADILKEEAASTETADSVWLHKIEEFSQLCEALDTRTHIAFLGTALLAKATDLEADVFAIKANKKPGAYSARTLAHNVLVPNAAALGIHLGVTGREPLNNQPYFRMERLDDGTRVHVNAKPIIERLKSLILDLSKIRTATEARSALRAFIVVRKQYQPSYSAAFDGYSISPDNLIEVITEFVGAKSEGGKRAQAVVAGLLEVYVNPEKVYSGRINDPSRHYPGDVAIKGVDGANWEKVFEVRDKPVSLSDVLLFGQKCLSIGITEVSVIAVSENQKRLREDELKSWSNKHGAQIKIFYGWNELINQILFWSPTSSMIGAPKAIPAIQKRLVETELSQEGFKYWIKLTVPFSKSA